MEILYSYYAFSANRGPQMAIAVQLQLGFASRSRLKMTSRKTQSHMAQSHLYLISDH